ncbi:hypothetical protein IW261DRAFT_1138561 [Armillaria novae-zelandiae]|uniref:Uncharacterized protein n=1 Tax=Armillaria novae-zelandiae TaxID=153914 RepID=A0AA39UBS0_9AGAR|nr:hypothetical protein IW261DRAFT_1138561 [Armillaria novae-zelandiae]
MYHHFLLFTPPALSTPYPLRSFLFCEIFVWLIPPFSVVYRFFLMILDALFWCNFGLVLYLSNAYPTLLLLLARLLDCWCCAPMFTAIAIRRKQKTWLSSACIRFVHTRALLAFLPFSSIRRTQPSSHPPTHIRLSLLHLSRSFIM